MEKRVGKKELMAGSRAGLFLKWLVVVCKNQELEKIKKRVGEIMLGIKKGGVAMYVWEICAPPLLGISVKSKKWRQSKGKKICVSLLLKPG